MSALHQQLKVGLTDELAPSGFVVIWRAPRDFSITAETRATLAADPPIPAPKGCTPAVALNRAARKAANSDRSVFVRPSETGGVLVVRQIHKHDTEDDFELLVRAEVGLLGILDVTVVSPDADALPDEVDPDEEMAERVDLGDAIRRNYAVTLKQIAAQDVTRWITHSVLPLCEATSLHTSAGGAWFVPNKTDCVSVLRRAQAALGQSGSDLLISMPAYSSDPALVGAVLDSLTKEVEEFCAVDPAELGLRALTNRQDKCATLRERVKKFCSLLDTNAPELVQRLDQLDFEAFITKMQAT